MNREKIYEQYKVKMGFIASPGKFEGEPVYAPYFYDISLYDCVEMYNEDCFSEVIIKIKPEDREMFPEITAVAEYVSVQENGDGFVKIQLLTEQDFEKIQAYYELWDSDF